MNHEKNESVSAVEAGEDHLTVEIPTDIQAGLSYGCTSYACSSYSCSAVAFTPMAAISTPVLVAQF